MPVLSPVSRRRALFVAYQFPPAGGIGVHRVVKFTKYLPEFGWESSVLTVANPSVPLNDTSLMQDIPQTTRVVRAATLEPGYRWKQKVSAGAEPNGKNKPHRLKAMLRRTANILFQPDMQILWARNAIRSGRKLLAEQTHDVIIATAPPFSSFYVGEQLARKSGLPLVLDYRDEWGISNTYWENKQQDPFSRWVQHRMQQRLLRNAAMAIATTPSSCESVRKSAEAAESDARCACIYNGYDPDDFHAHRTSASPRKDYGNGTGHFRIVYAGTLWNLNSVQPLVEALVLLQKTAPSLLENVELIVAGRRTAEQELLLDRLSGLAGRLVRLPFLAHDEAVQLMQTADCLVLLNSQVPGAERIVNGKIFEYLATQKPFLLISPQGDMWDLVADCPYAIPCRPDEPEKLASQIAHEVECHRMQVQREAGLWSPHRYERRQRAAELAGLLDELLQTQTGNSTTRKKSRFSRARSDR